MSLLKLLQEQTAENRDKTSIREVDEPHHYARGAGISGICFRRLDPINRQPTDAPRGYCQVNRFVDLFSSLDTP